MRRRLNLTQFPLLSLSQSQWLCFKKGKIILLFLLKNKIASFISLSFLHIPWLDDDDSHKLGFPPQFTLHVSSSQSLSSFLRHHHHHHHFPPTTISQFGDYYFCSTNCITRSPRFVLLISVCSHFFIPTNLSMFCQIGFTFVFNSIICFVSQSVQ